MAAPIPYIAVRRFAVGRYTCTACVLPPERDGTLHLVARWTPDLPDALTDAEADQYRQGRRATLTEAARAVGAELAEAAP